MIWSEPRGDVSNQWNWGVTPSRSPGGELGASGTRSGSYAAQLEDKAFRSGSYATQLGRVAQLVEHHTVYVKVVGSSPIFFVYRVSY